MPEDLLPESSLKVFGDVRFLLLGFDPVSKTQVFSKLVSGGGVDVGQYGPGCTHVIVDRLLYDDPVCVAARNDGKVLVNGLWVAHSFELGILVDTNSIMYKPPKDLNGIPGANSLVMCLTGYQRQDRDDIMTMVSLMGANFSKPLIASKVTHLICYKFEGEKYELAKRMKKIKIVNHLWLEDCLKAWKILPEADYDKSGYEMELLEAVAKDSEEADFTKNHQILNSEQVPVRNLLDASVSRDQSNLFYANDMIFADGRERLSDQGTNKSPNKTEVPAAVGISLASTSGSKTSPNSNSRHFSPRTYCRKISRTMYSGEGTGSLRTGAITNTSKIYVNGKVSIPNLLEHVKDKTDIDCSKSPSSVTVLGNGDKGNTFGSKERLNVSLGSSKSIYSSHKSKLCNSVSSQELNRRELLESASLISGQKVTSNQVLSEKEAHHLNQEKFISTDDETEDPEEKEDKVVKEIAKENGTDNVARSDRSDELITDKSDGVTFSMHGSKTSGNEKDRSKQEKVACGKRKLGECIDMQLSVKEDVTRRKKCSLSKKKNIVVPDKDPEKVPKAVGEDYDDVEAESVENQLGDHSRKTTDEVKDATKLKNATSGKRKLAQSANLEKTVNNNMRKGKRCRQNEIKKRTTHFATPEHEEENKSKEAACDENDGEVETHIKENSGVQDKSEEQTCKTDKDVLRVCSHTTSSGQMVDGTEENKTTSSKRDVGEYVDIKSARENKSAGQKLLSRRIKKGQCLSVTKLAVNAGTKDKKIEAESVNMVTNSMENDKKSMQMCVEDQNVIHGKKQLMKMASKEVSTKIASNESNLIMRAKTHSKPESACFIISGNKPQRKEFHKAIRRLKGKVCKDSHQWSYQATHFIVSDPIRRTEKFFAAAASGRWILKTDYIGDSSKSGKFLAEEPYEWHKSGLSEDGSINLEAPRKWRLQRQGIGHGAFYGMHIVIYGECIAPSLDTLKRVVKAGDGTILATSPPYSRFLDSGVDFAVVSLSTPHTDMWVQEFLRHEIPCVLADYLVEFVCKPGYSLERFVQFDTHAWAEKSFNNLVNKSKTKITPTNDGEDRKLLCPEAPSHCDHNNLPCQACGLRVKGEDLLICGNQDNGCGIAMHISCCNPPLSNVPKQGWLCPKCSKSKGRKRRTSVTKTK